MGKCCLPDFKSGLCDKILLANRRQNNWQAIHQNSTLEVTIDLIVHFFWIVKQKFITKVSYESPGRPNKGHFVTIEMCC